MDKISDELREALKATLGNPEWRQRAAKEIASEMADLLQQEYKFHRGEWWLFSLGEPARALTAKEVAEHRERGNIPPERSD